MWRRRIGECCLWGTRQGWGVLWNMQIAVSSKPNRIGLEVRRHPGWRQTWSQVCQCRECQRGSQAGSINEESVPDVGLGSMWTMAKHKHHPLQRSKPGLSIYCLMQLPLLILQGENRNPDFYMKCPLIKMWTSNLIFCVVKYTWHKISYFSYFSLYSWEALSTFILLCDHHQNFCLQNFPIFPNRNCTHETLTLHGPLTLASSG